MSRRVPFAGAMVAALVALACERMPGRPDPADAEVASSQVSDFAQLYALNCSGCHGADGRDGPARPLRDALYLAWIPAGELRDVIARGRAGTAMPGFAQSAGGQLTEQQIAILAGQMPERWGVPAPSDASGLPPYAAEHAGDAQRGATVFAAGCARCHGPDGNGGGNGDGGSAGSVVAASYLALVSDQHLRTTTVVGRADLGHPDWRTAVPGRALTSQEVSDVVAWISSRRARTP